MHGFNSPSALLPPDCPQPARLQFGICGRKQPPGSEEGGDTEHEATVSMFVLFLRSGGSVCGRDAARPVADAHRCAGANEGWAQGGAPHGQVGEQLVSILLCRREREKKKKVAQTFSCRLIGCCCQRVCLYRTRWRRLCRQHAAIFKLTTREGTSVSPSVLFPLLSFFSI